MGVVMRQGIKYSMVTYVFMVLSILASLFVYPLDTDLYGTLIFFVDTAMLFTPVVLVGMATITVKYYPEVKESSLGGNRILSATFLVVLLGTALISLLGYLLFPFLSHYFVDKSKIIEIEKSLWLVIPFIFLIAVQNFLMGHISNFRLIALPNLLQNLIRISLPAIFLLVFFKLVSPLFGLSLLILHFVIVILFLLGYLSRLEPIRLDLGRQTIEFLKRKDVRTFGLFAMLTGIGSSLAFRLDSLMITSFLDTSDTGVYSIGNKIGSIIAVPITAIIGIVAPIVSSSMKARDYENVHNLYKRSSEILTIAGVFILAGLAVIVRDLFMLMHDGEGLIAAGALYVVGLISLARFLDMCTSINGYIIGLSDFFRYNLYFLLILAVGNTVLNILLIPRIGIVGASVATCVSLFLFNAIKVIFIKLRFNMWPFTYRSILVLIIGLLAVAIVYVLDSYVNWNGIPAILVKGGTVTLLVFFGLYVPKVSTDFNHAVNVVLRRLRTLF
jgi:O-antigen/teichoic acid export membrane protein